MLFENMALFDIFKSKKRAAQDKGEQEAYNSYTGLRPYQVDENCFTLSAVYAATELICGTLAELPWIVRDCAKRDVEIADHGIYKALRSGLQTRQHMLKCCLRDMYTYGNGFVYLVKDGEGNVLKMRYLRAHDVTIRYNDKDQTLYYMCTKVGPKKIMPENMIHLVKTSADGITGRGLVHYADSVLKLSKYTDNTAKNFFGNGGMLAGVLETGRQVSNKQRNEIKNDFVNTYGGANSGNVCVLPAGYKYTPITVDPDKAELLNTRLFNLQEVARFFGISPTLLGDLSKSSYSTLEMS